MMQRTLSLVPVKFAESLKAGKTVSVSLVSRMKPILNGKGLLAFASLGTTLLVVVATTLNTLSLCRCSKNVLKATKPSVVKMTTLFFGVDVRWLTRQSNLLNWL